MDKPIVHIEVVRGSKSFAQACRLAAITFGMVATAQASASIDAPIDTRLALAPTPAALKLAKLLPDQSRYTKPGHAALTAPGLFCFLVCFDCLVELLRCLLPPDQSGGQISWFGWINLLVKLVVSCDFDQVRCQRRRQHVHALSPLRPEKRQLRKAPLNGAVKRLSGFKAQYLPQRFRTQNGAVLRKQVRSNLDNRHLDNCLNRLPVLTSPG